MQRHQLEHIIRAASGITGSTEFVIVGSQSVLGPSNAPVDSSGTLWTYAVMGNNWRKGVNVKEKTALVRHPIYLLQVIMLTGVALLVPSPTSFATVAIHCVCVQLKARDEERYLENVHGNAYRDYSSQAGGLFPRLIGRRTLANNASAGSQLISKQDRRTSSVNNP